MKAEEIVDKESFLVWLDQAQAGRKHWLWLSARSALRALPSDALIDRPSRLFDRPSRLSPSSLLSLFGLANFIDLASNDTSFDPIQLEATLAPYAARGIFRSPHRAAARAVNVPTHGGIRAQVAISVADAAQAIFDGQGETVSASFWSEVSKDCIDIKSGEIDLETPLWRGRKSVFRKRLNELKEATVSFELISDVSFSDSSTFSDKSTFSGSELSWAYWFSWYEDVLAGRPRNLDLQTEIALEVDWDKPPAEVLAQVNEIAAKYHADEQPEQAVQIDVFRATLFDFSYDALEGVMRAVPLARDWKQLDDPDLLAAFLHDAEELREDLQLFCDALAAEGAAMQGAGTVRTYCSALLSELERAEKAQSLRVGKLVQYGRMIENARLDPATQKEFGLLAPALQDNGQAVLDLMRNHFARTLSRFAELRDVGIEDDATHWEVLQGFRDLVRAIQSGGSADHPPLAKEDAVVLSDIMESVERQLRAMDSTDDDSVLDSLKREANFELAKLGATIAIFRERAVGSEKDLGEAADVALKWQKRGLGLWGIVKMLKKGLGLE